MNKVSVVFCFDNNFAPKAYVTISSLLFFSKKNTHYVVYCIINNDVTEENKGHIKSLSNEYLIIEFIYAKNTFENSHQPRGITESAYYRLMLHELIPNENKVIYLDVDVLINGDLKNLYETNLDGKILGGVKNLFIHQVFEKHLVSISYWSRFFSDSKYTYINSGILLMDLKKIRESKIWLKWQELATEYKWEYLDQCILNVSCANNIKYLPPKYNATYAIRAKGADKWDLFTKEELLEEPVIYHFTAGKPWDSKFMDQAKVWWDFVKYNTDQYDYFIDRYNKIDTNYKKSLRLIKRVRNIFYKISNLKKN